ncbi:FMN-dependent NADH-azoreductase [Bradyrhizobium yuanmingense]|uniref:FMN-dependent NADH-azoreductase n=1 Tax=Bradyrhizobium yuanmingense TaxID=108015 RepID=UPI003519215B
MQLLQIDSSARFEPSDANPRGSHSRRLTQRFVQRWLQSRPGDGVVSRDLGRFAPSPVTDDWVKAAFAKPDRREPWMREALAESDALVDELISADLIVAGVPMYNFGVPAQFKAYIDNIVRVGRTFGFDRSRPDNPYSALLEGMDKRLVLLGSRGDYGYDPGGRMAAVNHVEGAVRDVFAFIGITAFHSIAVEYDEFADDRLQASIAAAERAVDDLVDELLKLTEQRNAA